MRNRKIQKFKHDRDKFTFFEKMIILIALVGAIGLASMSITVMHTASPDTPTITTTI